MKFKSEQTADKLRGGYYTPIKVANFLARWAITPEVKSVLEPSCGDGIFFEAIQATGFTPEKVHGVELDPVEAEKARKRLPDLPNYKVFNIDFLKFPNSSKKYDAVVGNPPYIRYQFLEAETQEMARSLYERHSLKFTRHLNAWAPFVVGALDRMAPGGRLAMVIPAEILNVSHASGIRKYLAQQCSRVLLIDTQALMFEGVLQRTVLLMAEKRAEHLEPGCLLAVQNEADVEFLESDPKVFFESSQFFPVKADGEKWMASLLSPHENSLYEQLISRYRIERFEDIATVQVGIVTGANKFFLVSDGIVEKYALQDFAKPMFGRSNHVKGVIYSNASHDENKRSGLAANFLDFQGSSFSALPPKAKEYIQLGESQELHLRYKCRIRDPWYQVPSVYSTRLGLLKRSHFAPRLIVNDMAAFTTDTAYRIDTKLDPDSLAVSWLNSLTLLGAELHGRTYGGGVLELVPSEIRKLPIPYVEASRADLELIDKQIIAGVSLDEILEKQDARILGKTGFSSEEIRVIQAARRRLSDRRLRKVVR